MNTRILEQLEFEKVKDLFVSYLQTEQGLTELKSLVPLVKADKIKEQFTEIEEMAAIFVESHSFALGSLTSISESIRRLELEADLNITELIAIKKVLAVTADMGRFYQDLENVELVALKRLFENLIGFPQLQGSLQSVNLRC